MRLLNARLSPMDIDRRHLFALTAVAGVMATPQPVRAAAPGLTALGVLATQLGVQAASSEDQSFVLQRAIDQVATARVPLVFPPGVYRAGDLKLPPGTRLIGIRGASRLVLTQGPSLLSAEQADHVALAGLTLDGAGKALPDNRGLVHLAAGRGVRIDDCEIIASGCQGIMLEQIEGIVAGNTVSGAAGAAIFSRDARGLTIAGNTIRAAANNGILVWRQEAGDDGTLVLDNRIEDVSARAGGSGQNGNAINVFRAHNVVVRGNRIRGAAFSAVRGNTASNLQIVGNTCTGLGEVALYAESGFEGAVIANNIVDGAALGVSVTNFDKDGRLAVVQGNLIRNLVGRRPPGTDPNDSAGIGIGVEADTVVTGNVIEGAPYAGIAAGWGAYLRDVAITSNVIRRAEFGTTVSVAPGAGAAVIADNMISDIRSGAII